MVRNKGVYPTPPGTGHYQKRVKNTPFYPYSDKSDRVGEGININYNNRENDKRTTVN